MPFRYQDPLTGEYRVKRRYMWGLWGLSAGIVIGILITQML